MINKKLLNKFLKDHERISVFIIIKILIFITHINIYNIYHEHTYNLDIRKRNIISFKT